MLNNAIADTLTARAEALENQLEADLLTYAGAIAYSYLKDFRNALEKMAFRKGKRDSIVILLYTPGGEVEAVEKMVEMIRHHYKNVYFLVPDIAMSAGTILCMSGDKIYMDYSSSLGPIDPQVSIRRNDGNHEFVPALGYLDQVEKLVKKSQDGSLTPAEYALLQSQDLGLLRRYEQARDLSVDLLKKWLVEYKFKTWEVHRSDSKLKGQKVTAEQKEQRANEIASMLGNNKEWHSHGRLIGIGTLKDKIRLEIEDYSDNTQFREIVRSYNDLLMEHCADKRMAFFLHGNHIS